ncbi:MAG: 4Fe-4S ferredoxin [Bacteroides sp.]|nr:4Fe-4S ferredoxin [Bacteroides sp.]
MKRTIIKIDENLCDGCGICIEGCHEGALKLIDGKARLVSELYCDGLGACLGDCPVGAIALESREAETYDERAVMERLMPQGESVMKAHLLHLAEHGQTLLLQQAEAFLSERGMRVRDYRRVEQANHFSPVQKKGLTGSVHPAPGAAPKGCPGSQPKISPLSRYASDIGGERSGKSGELRQWPVQLHLLSSTAPYWEGADVLVAADCTAFAAGDFHSAYLSGRRLTIACPKLDEGQEAYVEKLTHMMDRGGIRSLTVLVMEVPCCKGLLRLCREALSRASRKVPLTGIRISLQGELLERAEIE